MCLLSITLDHQSVESSLLRAPVGSLIRSYFAAVYDVSKAYGLVAQKFEVLDYLYEVSTRCQAQVKVEPPSVTKWFINVVAKCPSLSLGFEIARSGLIEGPLWLLKLISLVVAYALAFPGMVVSLPYPAWFAFTAWLLACLPWHGLSLRHGLPLRNYDTLPSSAWLLACLYGMDEMISEIGSKARKDEIKVGKVFDIFRKGANGRRMTMCAVASFSMVCLIPCLIFTIMLNLEKNYKSPWRPNIWPRMHQVRSSLQVIDSRPIMKPYDELLRILGRFTQHNMNMDEAIQVSCIIDKLPSSWKEFKHTLKHKKEELTLVELGRHLHIEESLRVQDSDKPKGIHVVSPLVVNMVEHNNYIKYNDNKGKRKHQDTKADPRKKSKLTCWKCRIRVHLKRDCKGGKIWKQSQWLNIVNDNIGSAFMSTSKLSDSILWHARLGHQVSVALTKEFVSSRFSMKDMGEADVMLDIRIKHKSNRIAISQSHYIEKVLRKFNYFYCTPVSTFMDTSEKLMPNNDQTVSQLKYSKASKKQTCITSLIMESEFATLATTGKEAEWLRNLILEIPLWSKPIAPISIRCDSAATLAKAYIQMYNGKSRYLGVKYNMLRELIMNKVVSIEFVRSQQNLVDHLTKGLARDLVIKPAEGIGLKSNLEALIYDALIEDRLSASLPKLAKVVVKLIVTKLRCYDVSKAYGLVARKLEASNYAYEVNTRFQAQVKRPYGHMIFWHMTICLAQKFLQWPYDISVYDHMLLVTEGPLCMDRGRSGGNWRNTVGDCYMINIYGPQDSLAKDILWNSIGDFMHQHTGKYIIFGDMNVVRNEKERSGSVFSRHDADNFNSFIKNASLIDLPLGGRLFTWMNKAGTKLSKLDRFLISKEEVEALPDVRVTAIDRLPKLEEHNFGRKLLSHEKFRLLKARIKQWHSETKTSNHLLQEVDILYTFESFDLFQSACVKWDIEEGVWISDPSQIKEEFLNFFKEKFKDYDSNVDFPLFANSFGLCALDHDSLETLVSLDDVKNAVWDCGSSKDPGPDGFSFTFLKKYWVDSKVDILEYVNIFLDTGSLPHGSNSFFFTLIPKKWRWRFLHTRMRSGLKLSRFYMVRKVALMTMVASIMAGCGTRIRFWKDTWVGDSLFYIRYNRLFRLEREKDCLIIDRIDHGQYAISRRHQYVVFTI
ncbi:zinc finger, CCHC-type containing protein [Tanacetum coccineum]